MFFFVIFSILSIYIGFVWWRIVIPAGLSGIPFILSIASAILLLFLPFLSIFLRFSGIYNRFVFAITWLTFVLLGFITMLFLFLAFRDVLVLISLAVFKAAGIAGKANALPFLPRFFSDHAFHVMIINRLNIGLASLTALMLVWGYVTAISGPRVEEVTVRINGLGDAFDGFRIVQISDLHAGSTITQRQFRRIIEKTQALNGDIIALTGDIADGKPSALTDFIAPLAQLDASFGNYFVTGNHEYYSGAASWVEKMETLGFTVLINEHRLIHKDGDTLVIAGVTDYQAGRFCRGRLRIRLRH